LGISCWSACVTIGGNFSCFSTGFSFTLKKFAYFLGFTFILGERTGSLNDFIDGDFINDLVDGDFDIYLVGEGNFSDISSLCSKVFSEFTLGMFTCICLYISSISTKSSRY